MAAPLTTTPCYTIKYFYLILLGGSCFNHLPWCGPKAQVTPLSRTSLANRSVLAGLQGSRVEATNCVCLPSQPIGPLCSWWAFRMLFTLIMLNIVPWEQKKEGVTASYYYERPESNTVKFFCNQIMRKGCFFPVCMPPIFIFLYV